MSDQSQPQRATVSLSGEAVGNAAAVLMPIAVAVSQFLREERSYETIFLAGLVALLYFYIRGLGQHVAQLKVDVSQERSRHDATRQQCEERETKLEADMQLMRESQESELRRLDERRIEQIGTLETSLVNAFSDVTAMADRRQVGHFERHPTNRMLVYVRAPVVVPPHLDRRRGAQTPPIPPATPSAG